MITTRLAIAALVAVGLAAVPLTAQAKKHKHIRHYISTAQSNSYGISGTPTTGSAGLWDIRYFCWHGHRSVSGIGQLAFGGRNKRSSHMEQHGSCRSQIKKVPTPRAASAMTNYAPNKRRSSLPVRHDNAAMIDPT